ncbi:Glia maturation factor gamma [Myotis davidii]|uniref:Glia maturation factor gamma n=1 Tax=Myotis davidii TaxID=225400 RepID=L5LCX0_MYODS|nr:Glia maturation factor gamma [Myotis davidii]
MEGREVGTYDEGWTRVPELEGVSSLNPVCHPSLVKVDKDRQMVVLEEEFQNISPEELKMELPERQPRFVVYSYKYVHEDGRVSYPLCFIFSSPVFEIRTTDDLTEAWLQEKLSFFR